MKLETIKSFVLVALVAISLLLTLGLWNDSPRYERLYKTSYVNEVDVGGQVLKKKDFIEPNQVIFHNNGRLQGFGDPKQEKEFYIDMGLWALERFTSGESKGTPDDAYQIELVYPTPVPMKLLNSLFAMDENVFLPSWSFKRAYIKLDPSSAAMRIKFISANGAYEANARINDNAQHKLLWSYFTSGKNLVDYVAFDKGQGTIYLPADERTLLQRSLGVKMIDEREFVNVLFQNPTTVSKTAGEAYYTDGYGQRGMRVLQDRSAMEYINPIQKDPAPMDPAELIEKSSANINEHKGWTGDYNLFKIDTKNNSVSYKMYYQGYEIFNDNGLATIEQQWRNQELYKYRRPLIYLNNSLGTDVITLPSGRKVIEYLEHSGRYELDEIQDVRIGYRLDYSASNDHSVTLVPDWYILYKGNWMETELGEQSSEEGAS